MLAKTFVSECDRESGLYCTNLLAEITIGPSGKGLRAVQWINVNTRKVTLDGIANFKSASKKEPGTSLTYCPWCGKKILPKRADET